MLHADTIVRNANVITVDPRLPRAQAVAMRDGRFVAVGSNDDVDGLKGPGTTVLDVAGATVVPGFIDAHIHVLSSGTRHILAADCAVGSVAEVQEALRERARRTPPGEWVQGFKYDDTKTAEARFLTRHDLDPVTTDHPVYVSHRAGHVYSLNTRGLEVAGLHSETPDPPGGVLGRDPATGELTGILYSRAAEPVQRLLPQETPEVRYDGLGLITSMFVKAGLTSVHDAMVTGDQFNTFQQAWAAGDLPLRVYTLIHRDHFAALRDAGVRTGFGDDRLRVGGIKLVADGAIATRTAHLSEPYVGSDDDCGILAMSPPEMDEWAMAVHSAGFQVCVHANGDATIDMVLTAYEKAQAAFPRRGIRHRLEHCTVVNPDLLRRMKALGCVATPFCTYVYYHGEKLPFYGDERASWMFAQRSFIDAGIISTGATDYPPGPFEPLLGIQSCVTRADSTGRVWGPEQRISVEEALRLYTLHGAYASFEEDRKGSIEAGKLADLVVLGEDPTAVDPLAIKDIPVLRTVVGGRTVYEA